MEGPEVIVDNCNGTADVFYQGDSWGMFLYCLQYDADRNIIGVFDPLSKAAQWHIGRDGL